MGGLLRGLVILGVLGVAVSLASCSFSYSPEYRKPYDILAPSPVTDWLYRGSQPSERGLERLKAMGVKTVVNFRNETGWISWEKEKAEALGMKYVSLPWSIGDEVNSKLPDRLFAVLDDAKNRPVFMHCKHGRDRTGVMSVLALMRYENLPQDQAREQALETIRPRLRYRYFVNKKIAFFVKTHPELSSGGGNAESRAA